ncbi:MAG: hypothetical protein J1F42_00970 [Lachnospiraceae bacterium]|nr:hypothetical protein [Lachnospiraceae bacterium]
MKRLVSKLNFSYVIAFALTFFALSVFLVTEPSLSAAGDINIAEYLGSSKIVSGFFFISPALAGILRLFNAIYTANWWALFSIAVMFGGLYVFLWFLNKRAALQEWTALLLTDGLFVLFFWELMLRYEINFTQTTIIAGLSAVLLILDSCYECVDDKSSTRKSSIVKISLGVCLLFVSGSIRWKALALMLPFAVMCLGYFFVFPYTPSNLIESLRSSWKTKKKLLMLAGMVILVVFMSYGLHKLYGIINPDLGEYVKANALREEICDYADRYPDYEHHAEMYQELGIRQSWINMVCTFMTGDENYFSSEDLNKMAALRQSSHMTVRNFTGSLKGHTVMWISLAVLLVFMTLLRGRKQFYIPLFGCIFAFILCGLYFIIIGRIEWRVTSGCVLASALSYIAMMSYQPTRTGVNKFNLKARIGLLVLASIFFVVGCVCVRFEKEFSLPRAAVTDEERAGMLDYIDMNADTLYLDVEDTLRFYNSYNLWAAHEPEYIDNVISLVAHFIIGEKETLAAAGTDNLINDMLTRPNIYVRYCYYETNGIFLNYLRDYYDECISVSVVDGYGSTRYLRYSLPIGAVVQASATPAHGDVVFEVVDEFPDDSYVITAVQVNFRQDAADENVYQDYYLNVTDAATGALYSYGLKSDESGCSGKVLWMDETWSLDAVSVSLVGYDSDGTYHAIADVTEEFVSPLRALNGSSRAKH